MVCVILMDIFNKLLYLYSRTLKAHHYTFTSLNIKTDVNEFMSLFLKNMTKVIEIYRYELMS